MNIAYLMRSKKWLMPLGVSLVFVALLYRLLDWSEAARLFKPEISLGSLFSFVVLAFVIAWMYGLRWNWLLDGSMKTKTYMVASLLSIGGNMFLPARGGDLLRVHYSHVVGQVPYATVFSRLLIEKIVDLITLAMVGTLAVFLLSGSGDLVNNYFFSAVLLGFVAVSTAILLIKFGNTMLLRWLHQLFGLIGRSGRIERNLANMIEDIGQKLTFSFTVKPGALTIVMWLAVYVPSYILISQMVGVTLVYHEAIFVLFAAALGLMIPAAPSGIGTFHTSVVSAFLFLGRSPAEGLLVGTAIHLFYLIAYVVPAALLSGVWIVKREALH